MTIKTGTKIQIAGMKTQGIVTHTEARRGSIPKLFYINTQWGQRLVLRRADFEVIK